MRDFLSCIFIFLAASALSGQSVSDSSLVRWFSPRDFGKYFLSDMYSPIVSVQAGAGINLKEYNLATDRTDIYVPYNVTNLGVEIPVYRSASIVQGKKQEQFSISLPISVNIWFDFWENSTAPIINTDYRFGIGEINYFRSLDWGIIKNVSAKFIPLFHESTHLGDEITIYRLQDSLPVTRVNVSYETGEFAVLVNDPVGTLDNNYALKLGVRWLWNPRKGWYTIRSEEGDTSKVIPSQRWVEAYIQYQAQNSDGFLASKNAIQTFSLECRYQVLYGYPFYLGTNISSGQWEEFSNSEQYIASLNALWGWKFALAEAEQTHFGAYVRAYLGPNPHGQFRNIPFYNFLGVSFVYEW